MKSPISLSFITACLWIFGGPQPVWAGGQVVTSAAANGSGSLLEAIRVVKAGETITFDPALDGAEIVLGGTEIVLDKDVTLDASLLSSGIAISGDGLARVFRVDSSTTVELVAIEVKDGRASDGGGVLNEGNLTMKECIVSTNEVGKGLGGGIANYGTLVMIQSTIHGNESLGTGGGIFNTGILELESCTVAENEAGEDGGGIANDGDLVLVSCTIAGNLAVNGGGLMILNSANVYLGNSIVADNSATTQGPDIRNAVTDRDGVNFIGNPNGASGLGAQGTAYLSGNVRLGVLQDHGGRTPTMLPRYRSPVLDAGAPATSLLYPTPAVDQRGRPRVMDNEFPADGTFTLDIGAVEGIGEIFVDQTADESDGDFSNGDVSLREALESAPTGMPIDVVFSPVLNGANLILAGSELEIDGEVRVDASALGGGITISGNDLSRVIGITAGSEVELVNLILRDGLTGPNGDGGGIRCFGTLHLIDCRLTANRAGDHGGGVYCSGPLSATGSFFINNEANQSGGDGNGGGILATQSLSLNDCTLRGNTAIDGGALHGSGPLNLTACQFETNGASRDGGAVHSSGSLTSVDCRYFRNEADQGAVNGEGGALFLSTGAEVTGGEFVENDGRDGGAIANQQHLQLQGVEFSGNTAHRHGGAIHNTSRVVADLCDWSDNTARDSETSGSGGAIWTDDEVTLSRCRLHGNEAEKGGAVAVVGGTLDLEACLVDDNQALEEGGGILNEGTLTAINTTIVGNRANTGGSNRNGGGIYTDSVTSLIQCTIVGNSGTNGGGVHIVNPSTVHLENTVVAGNTANNNGPDVRNGVTTVAGVNFVGTVSGSTGLGAALTGNPKLGPLTDNGGPTRTLVPGFRSPLLDAGVSTASTPTVDQRGLPRVLDNRFPADSVATVDIGAVEQSGPVTVDLPSDDDDGDTTAGAVSLREAIQYAPQGTRLELIMAPAFDGATVTLDGASLVVGTALSMDASGLSAGLTLDGGGTARVLRVLSGAELYLDSVTITGGQTGTNADGGGIRNDGLLELKNCTIHGNRTGDDGGGIFNAGVMSALQCTLADNTANDAGTDGNGGGIFSSGTLSLISCTVSGNTAVQGGGVHIGGGSAFTLENTVVGSNSASTSAPDLSNAVTAISGVNVVGDALGATGLGVAGVDYLEADPLLAPLADNGGLVPTMMPDLRSPVVEAGIQTGLTPALDQRGAERVFDGFPQDGTAVLDVGAVEVRSGNVLVDRGGDSDNNDLGQGDLTLREAMRTAPAGSTLTFAGSLSGQLIRLNASRGPLVMDRNLTLDASALASRVRVSGEDQVRVMQVMAGVTASVTRIDFRNGKSGSGEDGGGILNEGDLLLTDCRITASEADQNGGGIFNSGDLELIRCTLQSNLAGNHGGGLLTVGGVLQATDCTIESNRASARGGGLFCGGAATLLRCTVSDNEALEGGGAMLNAGNFEAINATFSGNRAPTSWGGGIGVLGTQNRFISCTVAANSAVTTGGVHLGNSAARIFLANTLIAENTASSGNPDLTGPTDMISGRSGVNYVGDDSLVNGLGDRGVDYFTESGTDGSRLGNLANNGGFTKTMIPGPGSAALGVAIGPDLPAEDQRGVARPVGAAPDLGAAETDYAFDQVTPTQNVYGAGLYPHFSWNRPAEQSGFIRFDVQIRNTLAWETLGSTGGLSLDPTAALAASDQYGWRVLAVYETGTESSGEWYFWTRDANPIVTTPGDINDGYTQGGVSLREALGDAIAGERIRFDSALDGATLTLDGQALVVDQEIEIDASSLPNGLTLSGGGLSRLFDITSEGDLTVDSMHLTAGWVGTNADGGACRNAGSLRIRHCTVSGSSAGDSGGAIYNTGTLRVINSTLVDNQARREGTDGVGGAIWSSSDAIVTHATVTGNSAQNGGGIFISGATTVFELNNSIVANNVAVNLGPDVRNTVTAFTGVNLLGDDSDAAGLGTAGTDYLVADPMLDVLGHYGGATPTRALLPGSPAIDAGGGGGPGVDQRRLARAVGVRRDIGAYEFGNAGVPGFAIFARESLPAGSDLSFDGDPNGNGIVTGLEYATGYGMGVSPSIWNKLPRPLSGTPTGQFSMNFGYNPAAAADTAWIIKRTVDFVRYDEVYRFDGPTGTVTRAEGIYYQFYPNHINFSDIGAPATGAFYVLEIERR